MQIGIVKPGVSKRDSCPRSNGVNNFILNLEATKILIDPSLAFERNREYSVFYKI